MSRGVAGWRYIRFMRKKYGKHIANQFCEVIGVLADIRSQRGDLSDMIARMLREKLDALLDGGYN